MKDEPAVPVTPKAEPIPGAPVTPKEAEDGKKVKKCGPNLLKKFHYFEELTFVEYRNLKMAHTKRLTQL